MPDRVGVLGLGRMGFPIACLLDQAGFMVEVFDLQPLALGRAATAGLSDVSSARVLAARADVLVTVLPGSAECRNALLGNAGVLEVMSAGSCWVDLTSNDPRVAAEIAAAAVARGVGAVGAPMRGGPAEAADGSLGFYVAGADRHVERVAPILSALAGPGQVELLGADIQAGYIAKLLANTLWFGQVVAVTEVMLLGQSMGLDVGMLRTVLEASPGGSQFISDHLDALLHGDYLTTFGIDRVVEELDTVVALAGTSGTPAELTSLIARVHREALDRFGPVDGELLAAKLLEENAGRALRSRPGAGAGDLS